MTDDELVVWVEFAMLPSNVRFVRIKECGCIYRIRPPILPATATTVQLGIRQWRGEHTGLVWSGKEEHEENIERARIEIVSVATMRSFTETGMKGFIWNG
jgi:hypothetical protein